MKISVHRITKSIIASIVVVLVVITFLHYFSLSDNNKLAWRSNWFHGDKNIISCPQNFPNLSTPSICDLAVGYSNLGFPIQIPEEAISGPFWFAWTINICVVLLLAFGLIYTLMHKFIYGVLVGVGLLIFIITIPNLVN